MIDTNDCWLYAGYKNELGYGQIFTYINKKQGYQYAHRVSYETFIGNIPDGLVIDHLCSVRCCINPTHLEAVTARENTLRGIGVKINKSKTHCPRGHKYDESNTLISSSPWRRCKQCARDSHRRYYALNKEKWKVYNKK